MIKTQTLKGFRDFLPAEARKRQYVINTLKSVFESFGFEPLETPVLEYEEVLTGKYGEEGDKLLYRFEDNGKRRVAMRYDQTVPTARVVAQYENQLVFPFKRYQIQPVWRADKPQKGRYREFFQCDIDTIGVDSPLADAEIVAAVAKAYQVLGFKKFKILINDRKVFENLSTQAIIVIDKLKKIGSEGVIRELLAKKIAATEQDASLMLRGIEETKPTERLVEIFEALDRLGVDQEFIEFSPTIARGLDYYTGMIFETEIDTYDVGSVCSGGRYDNLIGMFAGRQIPAVGVAFGFDRTIEAMDELGLFPAAVVNATTEVLVTVFSENLKQKSLELTKQLREKKINAEIYLGEIKEKNPLEKQLKYAIAKAIPYLAILGPQEIEKNVIALRNLQTREQQEGSLEEILKTLAK